MQKGIVRFYCGFRVGPARNYDVFEVEATIGVSIDEILIVAECSLEGEWETQVRFLSLRAMNGTKATGQLRAGKSRRMPSVPITTLPLNTSLTPRRKACSICGLTGGGTMCVNTSVSTFADAAISAASSGLA
jgi:hypothetical protein